MNRATTSSDVHDPKIEQSKAASHGAFRVILTRLLSPDRCPQAVARVFQDLATVCMNDCACAIDEAANDRMGVLKSFAQYCEPDHVEEKHTHLP